MMMLSALIMRIVWPKRLFTRLTFNIVLALFAGHLLGGVIERLAGQDYVETAVGHFLAKDMASAIELLSPLSPEERQAMLPRLQRKYYRFSLGSEPFDPAQPASLDYYARYLHGTMERELGTRYAIAAAAPRSPSEEVRLRVQLADGTPLTAEVPIVPAAVHWLGGIIFPAQMLVVFAFIWIGTRQATVPLMKLSMAAKKLGTSLKCDPLPESGPAEIEAAAAAFNAMQRQITEHLAERTRILAAISHDLQTPLTRMKLRAELLDETGVRSKMLDDLNEMQALVQEGLTYARSMHSMNEALCRVDLPAFLSSLAADYNDQGREIALAKVPDVVITTRPHALRRIVSNLLDNALKFGHDVELCAEADESHVTLRILDRGPGIPEHELEAVLKPFYRVESSRSRETGGTGLGLAIAQQLTLALNARLSLMNRPEGGLEARIFLLLHQEAALTEA
jgi:signal transduction histidine kinase